MPPGTFPPRLGAHGAWVAGLRLSAKPAPDLSCCLTGCVLNSRAVSSLPAFRVPMAQDEIQHQHDESKRRQAGEQQESVNKRTKLSGSGADGDAPSVLNEYSGFRFASPAEAVIDTIELASVTPQSFFHDYVAARKPVIIRGHLPESDGWKGTKLWTNEYLRAKAGEATLKVEKREGPHDRFGRGKEVTMTFGEFLKELEDGNENLYLTTQELEIGVDDRLSIASNPVTQLMGDFPLRPALLGKLVPQNLNLWMGRSRAGTSSGLHHDYHDNLYILLRGRKRFRLYSPADAERMYTVGELRRVHPNGRINYDGQVTEADGREPGADRAKKAAEELARAALEADVEAAMKAVERGEEGAEERLAEAEAKLDEALEAVLDAEMSDADGDGEEEEEDGEEEEEEAAAATTTGKRDGPPDNFSRVVTAASAVDAAKFPLFSAAVGAECEVSEGQMLYLPAGWFHEVTSMDGGAAEGHMAFNYWFHPPDSKDEKRLYTSDFWPSDWEARGLGQD